MLLLLNSVPARFPAADQLKTLADLHDAGKLSDEEYAAAKSGVIGS